MSANSLADGMISVFHLVRLRKTLLHLDLAGNMRVTDDCIPALLRLQRLRSVTLVETGVDMPGLRKFAKFVRDQGQVVEVEFPQSCEIYITSR
jgi:hypothetical protein